MIEKFDSRFEVINAVASKCSSHSVRISRLVSRRFDNRSVVESNATNCALSFYAAHGQECRSLCPRSDGEASWIRERLVVAGLIAVAAGQSHAHARRLQRDSQQYRASIEARVVTGLRPEVDVAGRLPGIRQSHGLHGATRTIAECADRVG